MGLLDLLRGADINQGVAEWQESKQGVLVDVRTPAEYRQGHIPGSINVPLASVGKISTRVKNKETPLFVYCQSGGRSSQAVRYMKEFGYSNVKNIGGIGGYRGRVEV